MIIIGAGGHGRVVLSTALSAGEKVDGFLDDNPNLPNFIANHPILNKVQSLVLKDFQFATFGIGNNKSRQFLSKTYSFVNWKTLIHSTAYVDPTAIIGKGTVIFAGAVIQPHVSIGNHCIINTGVTVDHDCVIEDYSHLAPGVHLAGEVKIGKGTFVGIGTVVIPQIKIGDWTIIAAGSVVVHSISSYKKVMGVPAREKANVE